MSWWSEETDDDELDELDESAVRVRPNPKANKPRTKIRPAHDNAEIGMVLGVFIALRVRPKRPIFVGVLMTALATPPFLALGLGAPLWIVVVLAVVMGAAFDLFGVLWNTSLQRLVPAEALSRVAAYDAFGSLMFGPLGLLLAGHAVVWWGARESMIGASLLMLLAVGAALLSPEVRRLRAPEYEPVPVMVTAAD